jgi:8-oxo-dGTP diphosphatase
VTDPRQRPQVDVHLLLCKGEEVLLGQRINTGFADGAWHFPSGHAEREGAVAALIREAGEELDIRIEPQDVKLVHLTHHRTDSDRMALFFRVDTWSGEPVNTEPDKCAGWQWFPLRNLPDEMIPYARLTIDRYLAGETYSEHGWQG